MTGPPQGKSSVNKGPAYLPPVPGEPQLRPTVYILVLGEGDSMLSRYGELEGTKRMV